MSQELDFCPEVTPLLKNSAEVMNTLTHGAGLVLSVIGGVALLPLLASHGDLGRVIGCMAFCLSMIAVYAASTLSHAIQQPERKRVFEVWDQGLIYLMIAGCYTPFMISFVAEPMATPLLIAVWALAGVGFVSKIWFAHRIQRVAVGLYLILGWLPAICAQSVIETAPQGVLMLIVAGGLCYTIGVYFLITDKKEYHFHAIWHLFVIAGSSCHYAAVFNYVA